MTGPEHYAAAEDLLQQVALAKNNESNESNETSFRLIAAAQVHAQLAAVAAQVQTCYIGKHVDPTQSSMQEWKSAGTLP